MGKKVLRKGETPQAEHTALYDRITKIESEVLERIRELKSKGPKHQICQHLITSLPDPQNYLEDANYYDLYWKQYLLNDLSIKHARQMQKEVNEFERKLKKIDNLLSQREEELEPFQQKKEKIKNNLPCDICGKGFKDHETLLLHQKIKHDTLPIQDQLNNYEDIYDSNQEEL